MFDHCAPAFQSHLRSLTQGTPVVYVSFNYRLGPFGFPQGTEAETRGALNLGLKDQLTALQWVKNHIGAFGGDPDKVCQFCCILREHHLELTTF